MNRHTRLMIMIAIVGVMVSGVLTLLKTPPSQKSVVKEITTESISQDKYRGLSVTGDQNVYSDRDASAERFNTLLILVSFSIVCVWLGWFFLMRYVRKSRGSAGMEKGRGQNDRE